MDTLKPSAETARHYEQRNPPLTPATLLVGGVALAGLAAVGFVDRALFHWLSELVSIFIAVSVFGITWNARRLIDNNFFLLLGGAFLAVALVNLAHVLSHERLDILIGHHPNLPQQLRIQSRLLEASAFLLAPLTFGRRLRLPLVLGAYLAIAGLILGLTLTRVLPANPPSDAALSGLCWWAEAAVIAGLFLALIPLGVKRGSFDSRILGLIVIALLAAAASEIRYITAPGAWFNRDIIGHLLKALSSLVLYRAVVCTGFTRPYETLFHNLKRSEEHLRKAHIGLEAKVRERTEDLSKANLGLRREISGRRRLERQILEISESEQHRIGRDLHDGLGQHLTGIALKAELLAQILDSQDSPEAASAKEIEKMVSQSISQTRRLVKGLSPHVSTPEDLHLALKDLAESTSEVFGTECQFRSESLVCLTRPKDAIHLYRIAQEAVHNALKHGKAKNITITLSEHEGTATLTVLDDGTGFVAPPESHQGMGLSVMHYRAHVINGGCEVRAIPEGGTIVACSFPVPAVHEAPQQEEVPHA